MIDYSDYDLITLYNYIKDIDNSIMDMLNNRCDICKAIIDNKQKFNIIDVFDKDYERDTINRLSKQEQYENLARIIWEAIIQHSRDLEE